MNERLGYRINTELKSEYDNIIEEKYGHKRNRCGSELEKLMKLYLTIQGGVSEYVDDPEVQELLKAARNIPYPHTQNSKDHNKEPNNDRIQRLEEKIDQLQAQLVQAIARDNNNTNETNETSTRKEKVQKDTAQNQVRYRENKMDMFVACFLEEYGDYKQVSMNEIQKLVMSVHGVTDPRSIQNRINYLKASGCIESFAPNVYNVKF